MYANVYRLEKKVDVDSTYITPVLQISRYICPRYFDGYFEIFALSEISAISRRNTNDVFCRTGWETTLILKFTGVKPTV